MSQTSNTDLNFFGNDDAKQKARAWAFIRQENKVELKQEVEPEIDQEEEAENSKGHGRGHRR